MAHGAATVDSRRARLAVREGAAELALLNEEADAWQVEELAGDFRTTIDYINARCIHWKTPEELRPRIVAAAHAFKWRSRLATLASSLVMLFGAGAGASLRVAAKLGADDPKVSIGTVLGGSAVTFLLSAVFKPAFVNRHAERAKLWKSALDKLRLTLEKVDGDRGRP
jgi:hypothetical protein